MDVAVIVNPVSGVKGGASRGHARAELAAAVFHRCGVNGEVFVTERAGHACELARAAAASGAARVIAWGGDGTVNEVGRALVDTPAALGIVPAGSGNGLARALGIPLSPEAAIVRAIEARIALIDAAEIAGHVFLNVAGLGFDARVAHAFSARTGARGFQRYVRVVTRELVTYAPSRYRVRIDGERHEFRAFLLSIANGPQWGNGAQIAPGARLDDGRLDLVVAQAPGPFSALLQVPRLFTGTIDQAAGVITRRAAEIVIEADVPCELHVDGEPVVCGPGDIRARVLELALKVCH